jgi:hypothetical protein
MGSDGNARSISAFDIEKGYLIRNIILDIPLSAQGDWESMAVGPCNSKTKKNCIFIGNMGNNQARSCHRKNCKSGRSKVFIYKVEEPSISDDENNLKVVTLKVDYQDSNFPTNRADSESLFVVSIKFHNTLSAQIY